MYFFQLHTVFRIQQSGRGNLVFSTTLIPTFCPIVETLYVVQRYALSFVHQASKQIKIIHCFEWEYGLDSHSKSSLEWESSQQSFAFISDAPSLINTVILPNITYNFKHHIFGPKKIKDESKEILQVSLIKHKKCISFVPTNSTPSTICVYINFSPIHQRNKSFIHNFVLGKRMIVTLYKFTSQQIFS